MLSITALLRFQDIAVSAASASNKLGTQNYNVTIVIFAEIFASEKVLGKDFKSHFEHFPVFDTTTIRANRHVHTGIERDVTWHHEMNFSWRRRLKKPSILEFWQLRPLTWLKILLVKGKTSTLIIPTFMVKFPASYFSSAAKLFRQG